MKAKILATLAVGLLVSSVAFADDMQAGDQALADDSGSQAQSADNLGSMSGNDMATNTTSDTSNPNPTAANDSSSSNGDDMSMDTATGDDDY